MGVALLIIVSVYLQVSGRLRRAFDFPHAPANSLSGVHILLTLIVFLLTMQVLAFGRYLLNHAASPAASQPASDPLLFFMQGIAELVAIATMLWIVRDTFATGLAGAGLRSDRLGWAFGWAVVGYLAFWPACAAIAQVSTLLYERLLHHAPQEHQILQLLERPHLSVMWEVTAWTLTGLIAPVFEELLFRGLLVTWLRKATRSAGIAIVFSGLAFGIIHMPQWHLVPALSLLGILLAYLYVRTGSLTLVIFLHAIFNIRTLLMLELTRLYK